MRRWELDSVTYMNDKPTKQPCGFNLILLTCLAVASSFLFLVSSDFLFHSLALSFSSLAWLCLISKEQEAEYQLIIRKIMLYVLKICLSCTLTIWGQCTVHKSNIYCYVSLNTHTYTYAPQQLEVAIALETGEIALLFYYLTSSKHTHWQQVRVNHSISSVESILNVLLSVHRSDSEYYIWFEHPVSPYSNNWQLLSTHLPFEDHYLVLSTFHLLYVCNMKHINRREQKHIHGCCMILS